VAAKPSRIRPCVVKIGGSLAGSDLLLRWLAAIELIPGDVILVPGGGLFADAVRQAQKTMGFDDLAAHRMALLAMEQYGLALAALSPRLAPSPTLAAIQRAWRLGKIPVWAPSHMLDGESPVPPSWETTSDSLAAWLVKQLGASKLLLIKSAEPPEGDGVSLRDLVEADLVDSLFPGFAGVSGAEIFIAGPAALETAKASIEAGSLPGLAVSLA